MTSISICPHYLVDYKLTTPDSILKEIIMPLSDCLDECLEKQIQIVFSNEILEVFQNSFPWNMGSDDSWRGHLMDWYLLISRCIERAKIIKVTAGITAANCSLVDRTVSDMFSRFLSVFGTRTMHGGVHEEGIFISSKCLYPAQLGEFHYVINPKDDLVKVIYPWLRLYGRVLPHQGEFPFVPPKEWRKSSKPIKSAGHGYLDENGNSWEWDRLHDNHWDVQHPSSRGGYTNVSPDGRILNK